MKRSVPCSIAILILACTTFVAHAQDPPENPPDWTDILAVEGTFSFSDGSSVFTFHSDHRFTLEPIGISGRTIEGVWTSEAELLVAGQWGWLNGLSAIDDFREMQLQFTYMGEAAIEVGYRNDHVYPVYFTIERLMAIDQATYRARLEAVFATE